MKAIRLILLVLVGAFILYVKVSTDSQSRNVPVLPTAVDSGVQPSVAPASDEANTEGVPKKAYQVLAIIRSTGQPPEGYVGGRVFQNREHLLPADGDYREFDVDPHNGQRNAERIIMEWQTKKAWYTGDHYQTFTPLP